MIMRLRKPLFGNLFPTAVANSTLSTLHFKLHGRGWGHGVGLCQIGAAVMGAQGKTYDEILLFYYRNAEIKRLYE